jgi:hypothetical protein
LSVNTTLPIVRTELLAAGVDISTLECRGAEPTATWCLTRQDRRQILWQKVEILDSSTAPGDFGFTLQVAEPVGGARSPSGSRHHVSRDDLLRKLAALVPIRRPSSQGSLDPPFTHLRPFSESLTQPKAVGGAVRLNGWKKRSGPG